MSKLDAFKYAQYDPISILFGAHMLLIVRPKQCVLQACFGIAGIVCIALYMVFQAEFLHTCCYAVYPPLPDTYAYQGACDAPGTLANIQHDGKCVHTMPSKNLALLLSGIFAFLADLGVYLDGHAQYLPHVTLFLADKLETKRLARAMMLFPVTGLMFGTYERVTTMSVIFNIRLALLVTIFILSLYLSVALDMNYAWGCYDAFKNSNDGDIDVLVYGRCDTATSRIATETGNGHFRLWSSSLAIWCSLSGLGLAWIGLYAVRWIGWPPYILAIEDELQED